MMMMMRWEVGTLGDEDDQLGDLMPHQSWRQWKLASRVLVFPREPPRQSPGQLDHLDHLDHHNHRRIVSPEYNPNSWRAQWRFLGRRRRQASDPTPCHRHGDDDDDDDDDDEDLIPDHHNCNKDPG